MAELRRQTQSRRLAWRRAHDMNPREDRIDDERRSEPEDSSVDPDLG